MKLIKENCVIKALEHEVSKYRIKDWQLVSSSLPKNIFAFCRRGLILALPTNVNMCLWKMANSNLCQLCHQAQTQLNTVSMCNVALKDGRFTWRHNSVLYTLYHYISTLSSQTNTNVFVDLLGHDSPASFFNSYRPDLLIVSEGNITAIELSCCFETNFSKARSYEQNKHKNLKADLCKPCNSFKVIFVEFSTLGFPSKHTSDHCQIFKASWRQHGQND